MDRSRLLYESGSLARNDAGHLRPQYLPPTEDVETVDELVRPTIPEADVSNAELDVIRERT